MPDWQNDSDSRAPTCQQFDASSRSAPQWPAEQRRRPAARRIRLPTAETRRRGGCGRCGRRMVAVTIVLQSCGGRREEEGADSITDAPDDELLAPLCRVGPGVPFWVLVIDLFRNSEILKLLRYVW